MTQQFHLAGESIPARLIRTGNQVTVEIGDERYTFTVTQAAEGELELALGDRRFAIRAAADGDEAYLLTGGMTWHVGVAAEGAGAGASGHAGDDTAVAPMPGTVLGVHVRPGDAVTMGQTLLVIESMKMETPIHARRDGTVATVHVALGDPFDRGAALVSLEPDPTE